MPGLARVRHFNNAGAALPPRLVLDTVTAHLAREVAIGAVEAMVEAEHRAVDFHDAIAVLIGAGRDEIACAEIGTRAWDTAFYTGARNQ